MRSHFRAAPNAYAPTTRRSGLGLAIREEHRRGTPRDPNAHPEGRRRAVRRGPTARRCAADPQLMFGSVVAQSGSVDRHRRDEKDVARPPRPYGAAVPGRWPPRPRSSTLGRHRARRASAQGRCGISRTRKIGTVRCRVFRRLPAMVVVWPILNRGERVLRRCFVSIIPQSGPGPDVGCPGGGRRSCFRDVPCRLATT